MGPHGWTITEGWNPEKGTTGKHGDPKGKWISKHDSGRAVDMRPSGPNGPHDKSTARKWFSDPWNVYRMLVLQVDHPQYRMRFEPHDLDKSGELRKQVKAYLMNSWWGKGWSEQKAEAFLKGCWGNAPYTNGPHIHVECKAPLLGPVPLAPPGE
jgi:hypothetical protein